MKLLNIGCGRNYRDGWINLDLQRSRFVVYHDVRKKLPFQDNEVDVVYHSHLLEHLSRTQALRFIADCYRVLKPGGIMRLAVPDMEQICREYLKNLERSQDGDDQGAVLDYMWNKIELLDQVVRKRSGGRMFDTLKQGKFNERYVIERNGEEAEFMLAVARREKERQGLKRRAANILRRENRLTDIAALFIKRINPQRSGEAHQWMYDRLDLRLLLEGVGFHDFTLTAYNESRIPDWDRYALDTAQNGERARKPDSLFAEAIK